MTLLDEHRWTPIIEPLAQEVGLVCAAVYGAVWRKCQMEDGICRASLDTLGKDINVDRATVMRSIKKLCELDYLTDQTPDRRNAPHTYTLSKSVAECNSNTVVMRNSPKESVAEENKSVAHNNSSIGDTAQEGKTVAESHLKRVSLSSIVSSPKKESDREPPPPKSQRAITIPAYKVFVEVTDYHAITKHWRGEMARIVGEAPDDLEFWRLVVIGWTGKYPSRHNVEGMLDYYKRREIPGYQKASTNGTHQRSDKRGIRALEETGESAKGERTIDIYTREYVYPDGHREPIPPVPGLSRDGLLQT